MRGTTAPVSYTHLDVYKRQSLSGLPVDEYAVTDSTGVARFENVLIGTGYVLSLIHI